MPPRQPFDPRRNAQELVEEFGADKAPIPVERIAKFLGAQIRYSPLDNELSGMIYIQDEIPIIGVNSLHHPNRQRFTIAHEIGHLRLHKDVISGHVHVDKQFDMPIKALMRDPTAAQGTDSIEIQANQFASELLIPSKLLSPYLSSERTIDIENDGEDFFDKLAKKFRVSRQALDFRIRNLNSG